MFIYIRSQCAYFTGRYIKVRLWMSFRLHNKKAQCFYKVIILIV